MYVAPREDRILIASPRFSNRAVVRLRWPPLKISRQRSPLAIRCCAVPRSIGAKSVRSQRHISRLRIRPSREQPVLEHHREEISQDGEAPIAPRTHRPVPIPASAQIAASAAVMAAGPPAPRTFLEAARAEKTPFFARVPASCFEDCRAHVRMLAFTQNRSKHEGTEEFFRHG